MAARLIPLLAGLCVAVTLAAPARADDRQADYAARLARAAELRAQADQIEAAAKQRGDTNDTACRQHFFVNACRNDARRDVHRQQAEARRLNAEAQSIEREVKQQQASERRASLAAAQARRDAELTEREAATTAERDASEARQSNLKVRKDRQAEIGAHRKAAAEARHAERVAAHQAREARQLERAARRDAQSKPATP